jgi:hypothetical protein
MRIEILDPQAHGFHEPESAAIHDLGGQFPRIFQGGNLFCRLELLASDGHEFKGFESQVVVFDPLACLFMG